MGEAKVFCEDCGALTPNMGANLCADCYLRYRDDYVTVRNYVKQKQAPTVLEASTTTGVSVRRIQKMVRERMISIKEA
ncbi:hypothetical protein SAMN05192534_102143 [Alteribacillus persepolensis]|uniref:Flagellar operon protein TIGR03826 n=1 Tax=Alteribacillus persepolensis TaxID=568899 RepID=A0A1G8AG79_9BACI|nr:hypothetical protein [Alteribacillus persepolensis]SDH19846.1 hypothetical protein SAMN05192534_102143 [Alteribacillus persepolensis]